MTGSKTKAAQFYHRKSLTPLLSPSRLEELQVTLQLSLQGCTLEELGTPSQDTGVEPYTHADAPNPQAGLLPTSCHPRSRPVTAGQACSLWPFPPWLRLRGGRGEEAPFAKAPGARTRTPPGKRRQGGRSPVLRGSSGSSIFPQERNELPNP